MSELREKLKIDMVLRGYSPGSIKAYTNHVSNFAKFYNKSPKFLGEKEIRDYLFFNK